MISDSIKSYLKRGNELDDLIDHEERVYKEMHLTVLNDKGIPHLHKRGYKMPGYREVVDTDLRDNILMDENGTRKMMKYIRK